MIELNVLDALMTAGQGLMFASLIYFFYLVVRHGDLLRREGDHGSLHEARPTVYRGEPEHGMPVSMLDQIAASGVRMSRAR